jgi:hypothetical protein
MAQQKTKAPGPPNFFRRHIKLSGLILIIILGAAGIFIYEKVALELNKRAFQHARTAIDSVYADIVTQVGQPDNFKRTSTCSRSYQELTGYGNASCDVDTSFIYGETDSNEATSTIKKIQSVIKSNSRFNQTRPLSSNISDTLVVNSYYHGAQDFYKFDELDCTAKYVYDTPADTYLALSKSPNRKTLFIIVGCSGLARDQYYPLAN